MLKARIKPHSVCSNAHGAVGYVENRGGNHCCRAELAGRLVAITNSQSRSRSHVDADVDVDVNPCSLSLLAMAKAIGENPESVTSRGNSELGRNEPRIEWTCLLQ